ncbi:hypothetical protein PtB15_7B392 [Puccinia triticina]|nr:hypothetical protein PtB15_7B392 [Puccinia triticina]
MLLESLCTLVSSLNPIASSSSPLPPSPHCTRLQPSSLPLIPVRHHSCPKPLFVVPGSWSLSEDPRDRLRIIVFVQGSLLLLHPLFIGSIPLASPLAPLQNL